MLIGQDTRYKYKFVKWEAEVAIEQGYRIIGVNLDKWWKLNPATCPPIISSVGALFVSYYPQIVQYALNDFQTSESHPWFYYNESVYKQLGYLLNGNITKRPKTTCLADFLKLIQKR